ncbi:hypothetical protein ACS0TY_022487 [Phlomoides rotata]
MMKAVSFMYVKPPGYNAESAKAAEVADEKKMKDGDKNLQEQSLDGTTSSMKMETRPPEEEKKKPRPKDVFGRALPTEEQFEILKNAPRLETGVAGRAKPFGVEIRNVKCLRCGNYGHQSGDRECPLKDVIMPNEESRLKRDDPLTAILAQTDPSEPLKWELKQQPGMSPPRGGFEPDDPNQQIVAEDIFDEYGGFLGEASIPELLIDFSKTKTKKKSNKSRHKRRSPSASTKIRDDEESGSDSGDDRRKVRKRHKRKRRKHSESSPSESSSSDGNRRNRRHKHHYSGSSDSNERRHRHQHRHRHRRQRQID